MLRCLFILLLTPLITTAQIEYENRVEVEMESGFSNVSVYEFGENGILIRSLNKNAKNDQKEWHYQLYNTDLELYQEKKVAIANKFGVDETFTDETRHYTLFKNKNGKFSLVTFNTHTFELLKVDGLLPEKCRVSQMVISGNYAYFKCSIRREPFLYFINWKTREQQPVPFSIKGAKIKNTSLDDFQLLENSNEIFLYVKVKVDKKNKETYIVKLDDQGNKLSTSNLTKNIDKSLVNVSSLKTGESKYLLTGTYSKKSQIESEGLYFCKLNGNKIEYINFYGFTEFENFLNYLPEKKIAKIEKRKAKKESKGKEFKLLYRVAPHEIIERADGFILTGEAYYPTYRTETTTTTTYVNGNPQRTTNTVEHFDGYRYTHAFIAKFGNDGNLKWDQTFEMWPTYKPFRVKKFISIDEPDENSVKMLFVSMGRIVTKVFDNDGNILKDFTTKPIETSFEGDKLKRSFSNIIHWYDNYFIAYGNQKIKNKEEEDTKKKRRVYFFSKIKYE